ncbi:MAG: universal stress protein [Armatimonadota bacterium]|nr:universal stress protein [Armatimonadota bacterium]MDR7485471.1 universal stress protein [Armatimonadota bacterium]MDR7533016.1 universal stress protein [Armatimonadota bacterium]MDR7536812.1 universal stress protein [Armatimonadota bacterium]
MTSSPPGGTPLRVQRILAPTDFSPGAEPALQWAMGLADRFGARVTLLHVLDLSLGALAGLSPDVAAMPATIELAERVRADAQEQMRRLAARFPDATPVLREGTARAAIIDVAKEIGADLIVMGTHGRTGLAKVFFGSVAEHVVRHSPVPVLTVRQTSAS